LPPFNGGKRRLAGLIFGAIDRVVPKALWSSLTFVDGFLGGGAISLFAKAQGFGRVISIDIAGRSVVVGEALIANSRVRLTQDDVTHVLAPRADGPGPTERELVPQAFTKSQARAIDHALSLADESGDVAKAALLRLLAIRIALAAHPFSYARKGTIAKMTTGEFESITPTALPQYVRGLRLATFPQLWDLAERINQGVFEGHGEVLQGDTLELLPTIEADILYADPPYAATRGYEAHYKVLDQILGEETRPVSAFTAAGGAGMIDVLLERAKHIPLVVLSFGNETISLQELEQKFVRHGRATRAVEIPYARLAALSKGEKSGRDRELLVVGWDPESELLRRVVGNADHARDLVVPLVVDPNLAGSQGAPPLPLASDGLQESQQSSPALDGAVSGRAVGPLQLGIDEPEAVLREPAVDGDDERVLGHPSVSTGLKLPSAGGFGLDRSLEGEGSLAKDHAVGVVIKEGDGCLDAAATVFPGQSLDRDSEGSVGHDPTVA
jgi:16S rRNA G966 N2-methylase RsmD